MLTIRARFDVHAHAIGAGSPAQARELIAHEGFAGIIPGAGWTVEAALAFMDERGIELQLLSMPGALGRAEARAWNGWAATIVAAHPGRFGLLAALPMADPDSALAEIAQAADELAADGVAVASNYDGLYLGDRRLEPVFAELERRGLPVFVHPVLPPGFDRLGLGRPGPLIEYPMDTARTAVDAIFAGLFLRHPRLRMVLAHAGGVLPALADRIAMLGVAPWTTNPLKLTAAQLRDQLGALYLDTAIGGGPAGITPAIAMVGARHLLFGTDYPPAGVAVIDETREVLAGTLPGPDQDLLDETFDRLFPAAAGRAASIRPRVPLR